MNDPDIAAVVIPDDAQPDNPSSAPDLLECLRLEEAHNLSVWGNTDRCGTFSEALFYWRGNSYFERLLFLARKNGVPVGSCSVVPAKCSGEVRQRQLPLALPSSILARGAGYSLEQVETSSRLALPVRWFPPPCTTAPADWLPIRGSHTDGPKTHVVLQEDTLVASDRRGHRLGMLVKIANIRRAQEAWPAARSVLTWNASENRHMLAINTSLGFKPSGFEGEWQKRLDDPLYGT
ncbi:hypothetical protein [Arthrobacter sp. R4-81]